MGRVDRQRGEHREDPVGEEVLHLLLFVDSEVAQRSRAILERRGRPSRRHGRADRGGASAPGTRARSTPAPRAASSACGRYGDAGRQPSLQPCDSHHEELVEIAREDREEPRPLEQREVLVGGELEHARVEAQPGDLAVEEPAIGQVVVGRFVRRLDVEGVGVCGSTGTVPAVSSRVADTLVESGAMRSMVSLLREREMTKAEVGRPSGRNRRQCVDVSAWPVAYMTSSADLANPSFS